VVCLHDVSMIVIGVEGADPGKEEPSSHHVAPGMSLPQQPSHISSLVLQEEQSTLQSTTTSHYKRNARTASN
jgi:hypothetical protein